MRRTSSKDRARTRILNDDEIRAIWKQAEAHGTFGALVRLLLLTGQRRTTVASMRWEDVRLDGTWTIPTESRQKGTAGELVLPERLSRSSGPSPDSLLAHTSCWPLSRDAFRNYGNGKATFDAKLPKMPQWGLHDLRRTAQSLMGRAGVRPDICRAGSRPCDRGRRRCL